jgi:hypothetical protein
VRLGGLEPRWIVYALVDPRDGFIRYIGRTHASSTRLKCHLRGQVREGKQRRAWIAELHARGLQPRAIVLKVTHSWGGAWRGEGEWIERAKALGWPILNRYAVRGRGRPPRGIGIRWRCFTPGRRWAGGKGWLKTFDPRSSSTTEARQ